MAIHFMGFTRQEGTACAWYHEFDFLLIKGAVDPASLQELPPAAVHRHPERREGSDGERGL